MISFSVPGNPLSQNRVYRIVTIRGHGTLAVSREGKDFKSAIAAAAHEALHGAPKLEGPLDAEFIFYFASERPDWDGPIKPVSDALQGVPAKGAKTRLGGCITNDRQLRVVTIRRRVDRERPRLEVRVWAAGSTI